MSKLNSSGFMPAFIACLFLLAVGKSICAQHLFSKIPPDGTWAMYAIKKVTETKPGTTYPEDAEMTIRIVGTEYINMEAFRWIEVQRLVAHPTGTFPTVYKLLVKESDVENGKNPMASAEKFFMIIIKEEQIIPEEFDVKDKKARHLEIYFPYDLENVERLESKTIKTGIGELDCSGRTGSFIRMRNAKHGKRFTFASFNSDKSPFGTATFNSLIEFTNDGKTVHKISETVSLLATGTGAKSILPKLK